MKYAAQDYAVGMQGVGDFFAVDTTQRFKLGQALKGIDPDGPFGSAEFVYGIAGGTIAAHNLCTMADGFSMTANPTTANSGASVFVSLAGMTVGQYGWFQKAGACVVKTATSIAIGVAVGISTSVAGSADTNSAGRQILGAKVLKASTATETTTAQTSIAPGQTFNIQVQDASKFFVGMALSGTGVGGSAVVSAIDVGNSLITASVASTAQGSITLTGTYTGYLKLYVDSPFIQGAIT